MEIIIPLVLVLLVVLPPVAIGLAIRALSLLRTQAARIRELEGAIEALRRPVGRPETEAEARPAAAPAPSPSDGGGLVPTPSEPPAAPADRTAPLLPPPIPPSAQAPLPDAGAPAPQPAPGGKPRRAAARRPINWEQFMGARLFAWVGGFALFLAVAFFVKFSFDHDLVPPEVRIALGYLAGIGLLGGGMAIARRKDYAAVRVTAHTLCGTGVVALYAVTFAARAVYHFPFFGALPTTLLMSMVTAAAFLVAARLDAVGVAVLGLLGGFVTPFLVSPGSGDPAALFTYIALLDVGLLALVARKRWDWLAAAAAAGTVFVQVTWIDRFFHVAQFGLACAVFLGFALLFAGAFLLVRRAGAAGPSGTLFGGSQIPSWSVILLVLTAVESWEVGGDSGILLGTLFAADAILLALAAAYPAGRWLEPVVAGAMFVTLGLWARAFGSEERLAWVLAAPLAFGLVHIGFPIAIQRWQPGREFAPWSLFVPVFALALLAVPVFAADLFPALIWGASLLVVVGAAVLAVAAGSVVVLTLALLAACAFIAAWMFRVPSGEVGLAGMLAVTGGFGLVFLVIGAGLAGRILARAGELGDQAPDRRILAGAGRWFSPPVLMEATPVMAAGLPFLLLALLIDRVPLADPGPFFGLALALGGVLLGLCRFSGREWLPAAGLAATLMVEHVWFLRDFDPSRATTPLCWFLVFFAVYAAFPFVALRGRRMVVPWIAAALSGPGHFFLVHSLVRAAWPNGMMGLLPAAFAVPALLALALAVRNIPAGHPGRNAILAAFGGGALLFITLIFPIQFEREWLTIAWALEGAALLWLFHRIPHPGLRIVGLALLSTSFARLALNPAVLSYHPRAATPVLNWYLVTYGVVIACLALGARLLRSPVMRPLLGGRIAPRSLLVGAATLLGFLLLNIQIADFFTAPGTSVLTFEFEGSLARDMTYSIAWAFFALGLVVVGILRRIRPARIAGIALMAATLAKLFLHDLAALDQLYRIGALVGVAILAIVASFLYQKLMRPEDGENGGTAPAPEPGSGGADTPAATDPDRP